MSSFSRCPPVSDSNPPLACCDFFRSFPNSEDSCEFAFSFRFALRLPSSLDVRHKANVNVFGAASSAAGSPAVGHLSPILHLRNSGEKKTERSKTSDTASLKEGGGRRQLLPLRITSRRYGVCIATSHGKGSGRRGMK